MGAKCAKCAKSSRFTRLLCTFIVCCFWLMSLSLASESEYPCTLSAECCHARKSATVASPACNTRATVADCVKWKNYNPTTDPKKDNWRADDADKCHWDCDSKDWGTDSGMVLNWDETAVVTELKFLGLGDQLQSKEEPASGKVKDIIDRLTTRGGKGKDKDAKAKVDSPKVRPIILPIIRVGACGDRYRITLAVDGKSKTSPRRRLLKNDSNHSKVQDSMDRKNEWANAQEQGQPVNETLGHGRRRLALGPGNIGAYPGRASGMLLYQQNRFVSVAHGGADANMWVNTACTASVIHNRAAVVSKRTYLITAGHCCWEPDGDPGTLAKHGYDKRPTRNHKFYLGYNADGKTAIDTPPGPGAGGRTFKSARNMYYPDYKGNERPEADWCVLEYMRARLSADLPALKIGYDSRDPGAGDRVAPVAVTMATYDYTAWDTGQLNLHQRTMTFGAQCLMDTCMVVDPDFTKGGMSGSSIVRDDKLDVVRCIVSTGRSLLRITPENFGQINAITGNKEADGATATAGVSSARMATDSRQQNLYRSHDGDAYAYGYGYGYDYESEEGAANDANDANHANDANEQQVQVSEVSVGYAYVVSMPTLTPITLVSICAVMLVCCWCFGAWTSFVANWLWISRKYTEK